MMSSLACNSQGAPRSTSTLPIQADPRRSVTAHGNLIHAIVKHMEDVTDDVTLGPGNSIRAILKHLEDAASDVTPGLVSRALQGVRDDADLEPTPAKCASRLRAIPSMPS